jgi:hypothetical protein
VSERDREGVTEGDRVGKIGRENLTIFSISIKLDSFNLNKS